MSSEEAPFFVENVEPLIRTCSSGNIRGDGTVKPRAFVATQDPLEISVHRDAFCDEGCRDRTQAAVRVMAGEVRQLASRPTVDSAPPPIDHALICPPDVPPIKTRDELQANATLFAKHAELCRELAAIAEPCERLIPGALTS